MDACQDGICVLARSAAVKVGQNVGASPETLHIAKDLRGLGITPGAGRADLASKRAALDKSAVLHHYGEEGGAVDFLPEV